MQSALNEAWPYALGMFEASEHDETLNADGVFAGEEALIAAWLELVTETLEAASLSIPTDAEPVLGGRKGYHTDHLAPMLEEMTEVYRIDPAAEW